MDTITVKAFDVATSFDLKQFAPEVERVGSILKNNPLIADLGQGRYIAAFDYGSIVFFNLTDASVEGWIERVKPYAQRMNREYHTDEFQLILSPDQGSRISTEELAVNKLDKDIVTLVSIVLSRSVALEYFEHLISQSLASLEEFIQRLAHEGRIVRKHRALIKQVGLALAIEHELAYNLEVLDEPDVVWEGGEEIERLYRNLSKMFDLGDRTEVIEKKLSLISRSSEFIISRLSDRRATLLELAIVILILVEIVLFLILEFYR